MSASSYLNDQHHTDRLQAGYQQGYSEQQQHQQHNYQIYGNKQPHGPGYGQGYSHVGGYEQGLLYTPGEHGYHPNNTGSAQEYYYGSNEPSSSYQGVTHIPHGAEQQHSPSAASPLHMEQAYTQVQVGEDATPADGERGLGGGLLGSVAGVVAGHQVHHGVLGAVGGGIAGSLLENHFKKQKHKHDEHEDEYEYAYEHRRRNHHGHHHHHHHRHSRHRSHSRNGSGGSSNGDDGFREEEGYYGH
ncbi:hypothetical protein UA08_08929 [Talaromyces atroroseus]|uniref:Glycine zipper 2TM domain-containing protein n=1 Tax=Talaromyces atroroseus TaxID=1441469 RepID=A0A225AJW9_TALAT|nr:hypothetical protein UA08_08929 [Talaromyces atroroseus]OKL55809.1 hypothetical protein UA08_08929 [Talaromyces atroroseus]